MLMIAPNSKTLKIDFQEQKAKTMSLFRDGFKLEKKASDSYMKLQKGDNKVRILSAFIDGWEEWDENRKPIRYHDKPESPREGCKQFVACIVWNYNEGKIQIMQLTQATIIRAIDKLSEDEDWGPVFFYDIKITRSGDDKLTKYDINPSPKKPLPPHVEKAFRDKPINLEALFTGDDPFELGQKQYTPGVFSEDDFPKKERNINADEAAEVINLIGDDQDYLDALKVRLKKVFGSDRLVDVPVSQLPKIREAVFNHVEKAAIA
jgi:hypothetical protein